MACILLIEPDERISSELAAFLEGQRHTVTVCATGPASVDELRRSGARYDIVIFDMSRNRREDWATLDQIQKLRRMGAPGVQTLCFSTAYRGPRMHLDIERKGARFVYVR